MGVNRTRLSRRRLLQAASVSLPGSLLLRCSSSSTPMFKLSHFSADVTPPLGHGLLAGVIAPAAEIVDPLFAHGIVLFGADQPVVIVGVDWCEIRNDAHERWRVVLAEAAGTVPERVLVSSLHQHDTPVMDLEAQRLLDEQGLKGLFCDPEFNERTLSRIAEALRGSLSSARPVTHIGSGQARVESVASNRRIETPGGRVSFDRSAIVREAELRALPEGLVDPWLKTLSFWDGDEPLAALSCFAVHPITFYGQGQVSSDYVGLARARRQQDLPGVHQVYLTGCAGDVVAGKYNDGDPANRPLLAERVYTAMREAWEKPQKRPVEQINVLQRTLGPAAAILAWLHAARPAERAARSRAPELNPRPGRHRPELVEAPQRGQTARHPRRRLRSGAAVAPAGRDLRAVSALGAADAARPVCDCRRLRRLRAGVRPNAPSCGGRIRPAPPLD